MCKKKSVTSCLTSSYTDYGKIAKPVWKRINKSSGSKKTQASEELGSLAAIAFNAFRLGISLTTSQKRHIEFRGCGVFDLVYQRKNGRIEVKEAKGGRSRYGTRASYGGGKRVTQCTPSYNKTIAKVMKHSNYKGHDPSVGCATHSGSPDGDCKACVTAERDHRREWGRTILRSIRKRRITKFAVRGGYTKTCLREPKVIDQYKLDKNGDALVF